MTALSRRRCSGVLAAGCAKLNQGVYAADIGSLQCVIMLLQHTQIMADLLQDMLLACMALLPEIVCIHGGRHDLIDDQVMTG